MASGCHPWLTQWQHDHEKDDEESARQPSSGKRLSLFPLQFPFQQLPHRRHALLGSLRGYRRILLRKLCRDEAGVTEAGVTVPIRSLQ